MTENDVFSAEDNQTVTVTIGNVNKTLETPVELDDVQRLSREEGIKKFQVKDSDGDKLTSDDFPVSQNISVTEYNENA